MSTTDTLVDNAVNLFMYLTRMQELKEKRVSDLESYKSDGQVLWYHALPTHEAVKTAEEITSDEPFLVVGRIDPASSLLPPQDAVAATNGAWDDPTRRPQIIESASDDAQLNAMEWLEKWDKWAERELHNRPARELYERLFQLRREIQKASESFELILGFGLLTWQPRDHERVRRHMFTVGVEVGFDDVSGEVTLSIADSQTHVRSELNMLDPGLYDSALPSRMQELSEEFDPIWISAESSKNIGVTAANLLSPDGRYEDMAGEPQLQSFPTVSYSPALILRRKGQRGFTVAFSRIAQMIAEAGKVPDGLIPLVDPDQPPAVVTDSSPGAIIEANQDEVFSPLPLNNEQEAVLKRADAYAQVVVQGPPGTGKTHTAAALITHLLAQGKRILVTAYTDRALYEVRGKLPEDIQDLAVSAIGHSSTEQAELQGSISTIASASDDFDMEESRRQEQDIQHEVSAKLSARERLTKKLVDALLDEARTEHLGTLEGTKAALIQQHSRDADEYRWILNFRAPATKSPLLNQEAQELLDLLRDSELRNAAEELELTPTDLPELPSVEEYSTWITDLLELQNTADASAAVKDLAGRMPELDDETVVGLRNEISDLEFRIREVESADFGWRTRALREISAGAVSGWATISQQLPGLLTTATNAAQHIGAATPEPRERLAEFRVHAVRLRDFVAGGNTIPTKADGSVKVNKWFGASVLKDSVDLFNTVRIGGRVPTSQQDFDIILAYIDLDEVLARAESLTASVQPAVPGAGIHERIAALQQITDLLDPVMNLGVEVNDFNQNLRKYRLPSLNWESAEEVSAFRQALSLSLVERDVARAQRPIEELATALQRVYAQILDAPAWFDELAKAVQHRDPAGYSHALEQKQRLEHFADRAQRYQKLLGMLSKWSQELADALVESPDDAEWDTRFGTMQEAADWVRLGKRIEQHHNVDVNGIQEEIRAIDDELHQAAGKLSRLRAWREAVDRLTLTARAQLTNYVQQTKKLGKGTGKYAAERRAKVRRALDECREYVPVWIMPLNRVVEQVSLKENSFDVVIVDEASQAGMEAAFLQFLAPRIVVIGDDKQVSPSAIGVKHDEVNELGNQYLNGLPLKDALTDPERSYFDDAVMRFSGKVTLKEHRRCVPEIINFSNRIAYEPEKIRLEPVRQVSRDRLDPFKVVYSAGGAARGAGDSMYNETEAKAVVDAIVACLDDPRYDGLSFGVISLAGQKQVKLIEQLLSTQVPPHVIEERNLLVGLSPDFQGAERDVMFLSMVASLNGNRRIQALTKTLYVQRYNVAVSRAKDQVWLFHSLRRSDVTTPGDMRHELLEYAYDIASRTTKTLEASLPVDEHASVEPFDSLFEQRVYNRIVARGFSVTPQVSAIGYFIDLVVEGIDARVAVECDGDYWHGEDASRRDLARQRNLARVGWPMFRIRESDFYADEFTALEPLWALLEEKGIQPGEHVDEMNDSPSGNFYRVAVDGSIEQLNKPGDSEDIDLEVIDNLGQAGGKLRTKKAADSYGESEDYAVAYKVPEPTVVTHDTFASEPEVDVWSTNMEGSSESWDIYEPADEPAPSEEVWAGVSNSEDASDDLAYEEYKSFHGELPPVVWASTDELVDGLIEILRVEGPAKGTHLFNTFVRVNGSKLGKNIRESLRKALDQAKRKHLIYEENPMNEWEVPNRTFRLPDQPEIKVRTIGSRGLEDVPDEEMLVVARHYAASTSDQEEVLRKTLNFFGGRRLTQNVRARIEPIVQKAVNGY